MRIAIIGAGIVGLATAHALLDRGHQVVLVEPGGKQGRPTDGNAGWIAHTDIMPLTSPKAWRNLPRWLMDPLGPLTIRPAYLPQLTPWLLRFLLASSPSRIKASIGAIRSINGEALPAWKSLLSSLNLSSHLREKGILSVWRHRDDFLRAQEMIERQRRFGIEAQALSPAALAEMEPVLRNVEAAVLYPDACHVSDPAWLAADLLRLALERGAVHVAAQALGIDPRDGGIHVRTDGAGAEVAADRAVVSAGIWSRSLAAQLGDRIPLDTERGYNATYPQGSFGIGRPIMFEGEGFVTTPLDTGDRVGGAVEFAGLEAAPNHRRTDAMVQRLTRFLPHLESEPPARRWMGFRPSIPDSLPVIGRARRDRRVVYAFGHGHYGLTQAAVTAQMVAGLVEDRPGPVATEPFSAQRF
ncbi:NAD(P)/FAD-dependent oxidoreductase [Microvirga arsenatis]|uniref:FAD-dependent oxidoreductase n=1 Tax=Microvirga arsenatis TaxID=2692265 RepID=A0ABW9Z5N5_9HYPH|nr:FAD-binding oxidoreductase [Microvirga arsenatis]NBJ12055.1 FAD-dependent oxidoreductase [Microvirga arsenatis]NBJ25954.1 FAD-dependent oxidoreductase [Microvirga arsenatis]